MSNYNAPIRDMQFVMRELAGLDAVAALPGCEDASPDVVAQAEADRAASGITTVTYAVDDAYALDSADDRWDVVHAHQVLQLLTQPPVLGAESLQRWQAHARSWCCLQCC